MKGLTDKGIEISKPTVLHAGERLQDWTSFDRKSITKLNWMKRDEHIFWNGNQSQAMSENSDLTCHAKSYPSVSHRSRSVPEDTSPATSSGLLHLGDPGEVSSPEPMTPWLIFRYARTLGSHTTFSNHPRRRRPSGIALFIRMSASHSQARRTRKVKEVAMWRC